MSDEYKSGNITERLTVAGAELFEYAKELVRRGNVRRLLIRKPDGGVLLEVPLVAGAAVGGILILVVPMLAAIAAVAALVAKIQVEIIPSDSND